MTNDETAILTANDGFIFPDTTKSRLSVVKLFCGFPAAKDPKDRKFMAFARSASSLCQSPNHGRLSAGDVFVKLRSRNGTPAS